MCLTVDMEKHKPRKTKNSLTIIFKPKVAKKDIICWKYLKPIIGGGQSIVYNCVWKFGEMKKIKMKNNSTIYNNIVGEGLHGFLKENAVFLFTVNKRIYDTSTTISMSAIGYDHTKLVKEKKEVNAKMIIPKGSLYYFGINGDIVANKMKFVNFLKK